MQHREMVLSVECLGDSLRNCVQRVVRVQVNRPKNAAKLFMLIKLTNPTRYALAVRFYTSEGFRIFQYAQQLCWFDTAPASRDFRSGQISRCPIRQTKSDLIFVVEVDSVAHSKQGMECVAGNSPDQRRHIGHQHLLHSMLADLGLKEVAVRTPRAKSSEI